MQYVPTCFRLEAFRKAYDDPVRPVGLYQFQSAKTELLPSTTKKLKGAPTKRIPSKGEGKNLCSRCGKVGHNKTCKNPLNEKSAPKKSAPKKSAPKKSAKKSAPKKSAPKKSAPKKSAPKKSAPKKTVDTSTRRNRISGKRKKCDSSSSSDEL